MVIAYTCTHVKHDQSAMMPGRHAWVTRCASTVPSIWNEAYFLDSPQSPFRTQAVDLVSFSPGGQPAPSRSYRRVRRTSCRSASGRVYTLPRGPSWSHCTLLGMPSVSFPCPWCYIGHPSGRQRGQVSYTETQAVLPGLCTTCHCSPHLHPSPPAWRTVPTRPSRDFHPSRPQSFP